MNKLDIINKLKHYIYRKNVYKLLQLSVSLNELNQICLKNHFHQVPDLILQIIHEAPMIPNNSHIKNLLLKSVSKIRQQQLLYFQNDFEKHLIYESGNSGNINTNTTEPISTDNNNNNNDDWESFLAHSKVWLLAYTSVSLLPVILTETKSLLPERYLEYLDEALTPLWGRFHFHLCVSQDNIQNSVFHIMNNAYTHTNNTNSSSISSNSNSSTASSSLSLYHNHLQWIFTYSRNFLHLILGLCTEMAQSKQLQQLLLVTSDKPHQPPPPQQQQSIFHGDVLVKTYILDKAVKFLRAYVAHVLVIILSSTDRSNNNNNNNNGNKSNSAAAGELENHILMALVNEILSLDHYCQLIHTTKNNTHAATTATITTTPADTRLRISAIVYDARDGYYRWLLTEHTSFTQTLWTYLSAPNDLFVCEFGLTDRSTDNIKHAVTAQSPKGRGYNCCYKSVYQCMKLFILGSQRYQV
jgi:hypothetical protein